MKIKISIGLLFLMTTFSWLQAQSKPKTETPSQAQEAVVKKNKKGKRLKTKQKAKPKTSKKQDQKMGNKTTSTQTAESTTTKDIKEINFASDSEKSLSVHLAGQFQAIASLSRLQKSKIYRVKDEKLLSKYQDVSQKGDFSFASRAFQLGLDGKYNFLRMFASMEAENDFTKISLNSAGGTLEFMPEVDLSLGLMNIPIRSEQQSPYFMMGVDNGFYAGTGSEISTGAGFLLHGIVKNLFEYSFGLFNGYQPNANDNPSRFHAPLMAMQVRFHVFGKPGDNQHYHFDGKNRVQLGSSFAWQHIPGATYYPYGKGKKSQHLLHWDMFMSVEFAIGKNSILLDVLFEGLGNNPFRNSLGSHTRYYNRFGRLSAGMGFYVSSLKLMPAFRYGLNIEQNNPKVTYIYSSSNHLMEVSLGYFPFNERLNIKLSYLAHYTTQKNVGYDRLPYMTYNHKTTLLQTLVLQMQFMI